jgi:SOS-response transcriptional repressor LexA
LLYWIQIKGETTISRKELVRMAKGVYERKPRPCPTREKLLQYIILFREDHGYSPSIREMATAVGVRSTCTISQHLVFLEEKGLITHTEGKWRDCIATTSTLPISALT